MRLPFAIALLISTAFSAHAQYKVVGPDGRITYTDRPVAPAIGSQVQTMRTGGVPGQGAAAAALRSSFLSAFDTRSFAGPLPRIMST